VGVGPTTKKVEENRQTTEKEDLGCLYDCG